MPQVGGVNGTGGNGTIAQLKLGAFTVWNGNTWGLRRSLLPWLQWHTQLGVCRFYVSRQCPAGSLLHCTIHV